MSKKDYFDINSNTGKLVIAYIPIVGLLLLSDDLKKLIENNLLLNIIRLVLLLSPICIIYLLNIFIKNNQLRILKKRKLQKFIIESQLVRLDISDNGKYANYYINTVFYKMQKVKDYLYMGKLFVDCGEIRPLGALNCAYKINMAKDELQYYHIDQTSNLNQYKPIIETYNKFFILSAELHNAFCNSADFWDLISSHYCRDYQLEITFPKNATLKSVKLFERISEEGMLKENENKNITPIITRTDGRYKIFIKIVDYDYPHDLRLKWEVNY